MLLRLLEENLPLDMAVFYNTGMEFDAIYRIRDEVKPLLARHGVEFVELCPAEPFLYSMLERKVVSKQKGEHFGYGFGVLMPNGVQGDIDDSINVVNCLGIQSANVNIGTPYRELIDAVDVALKDGVSTQTIVNLPPRLRMATLYAIAQSLPNGGRVANTCNMSEDFVGYSTKFGDSAGDFSPLANLTVNEVLQIGSVISNELSIPEYLIIKTPSDGLCGKTDEDNLGFTYRQLDEYILSGTSGDERIDRKIAQMHKANLHKVRPMPTFDAP